jgi:hypothetical protein
MTEVEYVSNYAAQWRSPTVDIKGVESLKYLTPVMPPQYLQFAEADLLVGGSHGHVNALSNAKRAIDCQVTNILQGFGLSIPKQFPAKLEKISALDLVAPRIVKKIVRLRNLLEHEFHDPNVSEVEDAVDVATLFIEATRPVFSNGIVTSFWVADEASTNRQHVKRTKTKTIIDNKSPEFTFACGIFAEFEVESRALSLLLVHENKEVGDITLAKTDKRTIPLLNFMGRLEFNGKAYTVAGAREVLALIQGI